jgi:hypothetical protein
MDLFIYTGSGSAGCWIRVHNEELHKLYASLDIRVIKSRRMRCAEPLARMGELRNEYRILVGKREETRPLGRPKCRREDIIRMDLREIWQKIVDWIHLAQDKDQWRAVINTELNFRVPLRSRNFVSR